MGHVATPFPSLACVLVLTLVLAGCSGFGGENGAGSGSDSEGVGGADVSVTPAPVPAVENTTSSGTELAPGLSTTGVRDPDALVAAHRRIVDENSYTVRTVSRATGANGTVYYRSAATTRVTERGERYYYIGALVLAGAEESGLMRYESWSNGRIILTASLTAENATSRNTTDSERAINESARIGGNATYERIPAEYERNAGIYGPPQYGERIYARVSGAETTVRDRTDTAGPAYYVVALTTFSDPSTLNVGGGRFRNVRNASGRLLVSPEGLIREYRLTYTATTRDGSTVRVTRSITYSKLGRTSVTRPAWYDEAIAATTTTTTDGANASDDRA